MGFDSINVVDPVYTIPLLAGLVMNTWWRDQNKTRINFNHYGLIISTLYLAFTLANKQFVASDIATKYASQNIEYHDLMTMPVGIANTNWYGVAKNRDSIYLMQHDVWSDQVYSVETFPINEHYLDEVDEEMAELMRWFAKGFYTVDKKNEKIRIYNLQVDMRGIVRDGTKKAPTAGYF